MTPWRARNLSLPVWLVLKAFKRWTGIDLLSDEPFTSDEVRDLGWRFERYDDQCLGLMAGMCGVLALVAIFFGQSDEVRIAGAIWLPIISLALAFHGWRSPSARRRQA